MTPVEEAMRALDDMVRAGKILYVGISDTPVWIVSRANMLADLQGWIPFVGLQIEFSLVERTVEREFMPMARSLDLAATPWPVRGGVALSGKYNDSKRPDAKRDADDQKRALLLLDQGARPPQAATPISTMQPRAKQPNWSRWQSV